MFFLLWQKGGYRKQSASTAGNKSGSGEAGVHKKQIKMQSV
jgi:hypothetical protein